ncbi:hypothetical protein L202_00159 [Cryptococcus amylolentus CBS 6039]|uniref:NAD(P)-binding domain-containing protein n=1 Tax=Cryptococcus amylolentus CBS 6039 TaxID=1295533 RepID=A0A1E3I717_9TREE|nr:hypothetical protein L202_00159 [Cryptococcus amylolentus CBS 6039]ODN84155.1 hypothetical protein L202_00159 [Cryptococcus amylolentus CBS 6039]
MTGISNNQDNVIFITGTSRGIEEGIARHYLKEGWTVVAAVRSPEAAPRLEGRIITVKADQSSLTDFKDLKTKHNITHFDIVVASSGVAASGAFLAQASPTEFDHIYKVNTRGPLVLYQATRSLLKDDGTFVVILLAAVNYLTRTIHHEEPALKAFTINPGAVDTKMIRDSLDAIGNPGAVENVVPGIVNVISTSTKEENSGWMWNK